VYQYQTVYQYHMTPKKQIPGKHQAPYEVVNIPIARKRIVANEVQFSTDTKQCTLPK